VVNDNSFDESKYILEEYQKRFRQLQLIELKQEARFIPGKKFPLSIGIKTAKYEIVLLTDADCVPASEFWIEKMQEGLATEQKSFLATAPFTKKRRSSTNWSGGKRCTRHCNTCRMPKRD